MKIDNQFTKEIRSKPIYFWAFTFAFISCAFIACFLTLTQLVMHDFPKWADYSVTATALLFSYVSIKQGVNFYRIKKGAMYYFFWVHCISILALLGLMIKDWEWGYSILIFVLCGIVAMQWKLISIVKRYYRVTPKEDS